LTLKPGCSALKPASTLVPSALALFWRFCTSSSGNSFVLDVNPTVGNILVEYSRPQENGNKVDVRRVKYTDKNRLGVKFTADSLIATSASHYSRDDIERSRRMWQMQPSKSVYVNIDLK
jgi:beta-galactosidase